MWRRTSWQRVLTKAEKLVGYPSSFLNLRYLLSDELSNVVLQIRQLVGTQHPLLRTVRGMVGDGKTMAQNHGLVVLLLARSAASSTPLQSSRSVSTLFKSSMASSDTGEHVTGLLPGQRSLAEIVETVHMALLFHRGIVNMDHYPNASPGSDVYKDLEFGNKMTTLIGDFLLASVSTSLAQLHNTQIMESVSEGISEMVEAEFTPLACTPHSTLTAVAAVDADCSQPQVSLNPSQWEHYVHLSRGSLLSRCAIASLQLADPIPSPSVQETVTRFASQWSWLYRLAEERSAMYGDGKWPWEEPGLAHIVCANAGVVASSQQGLTSMSAGWTKEVQSKMESYAKGAQEALHDLPVENDATQILHEMVDALCEEKPMPIV